MKCSAAVLLVLAACARPAPPVPAAPTSELAFARLSVPPPVAAVALALSVELRVACKVHDVASVADAPKLGSGAGTLSANEVVALQLLATCFTTGPLAGRTIRLVGRADPRGRSSSNMTLGEKRANAVLGVLIGCGLPLEKIITRSRGGKDANGTDDEEWQVDRRVDIDVSR